MTDTFVRIESIDALRAVDPKDWGIEHHVCHLLAQKFFAGASLQQIFDHLRAIPDMFVLLPEIPKPGNLLAKYLGFALNHGDILKLKAGQYDETYMLRQYSMFQMRVEYVVRALLSRREFKTKRSPGCGFYGIGGGALC